MTAPAIVCVQSIKLARARSAFRDAGRVESEKAGLSEKNCPHGKPLKGFTVLRDCLLQRKEVTGPSGERTRIFYVATRMKNTDKRWTILLPR
jgi:hypothetical protein